MLAILALTLLLPATSSAALAPDPCRLLTPAEVRASLGAVPTAITPDGPVEDPDLGAMSWSCSQDVGAEMLTLTFVEFASASAAAGGMATMMKVVRETPEAMLLNPAAGVGERSAWGYNDTGGMWVAIKGRYLLSLAYGQQTPTPATQRESLRQLATLALGRLSP